MMLARVCPGRANGKIAKRETKPLRREEDQCGLVSARMAFKTIPLKETLRDPLPITAV